MVLIQPLCAQLTFHQDQRRLAGWLVITEAQCQSCTTTVQMRNDTTILWLVLCRQQMAYRIYNYIYLHVYGISRKPMPSL